MIQTGIIWLIMIYRPNNWSLWNWTYLSPANEVWDKVMFLHLSVILFTDRVCVSQLENAGVCILTCNGTRGWLPLGLGECTPHGHTPNQNGDGDGSAIVGVGCPNYAWTTLQIFCLWFWAKNCDFFSPNLDFVWKIEGLVNVLFFIEK